MDTTSLFDFEFVDRYKERKIFFNYATTRNSKEIMWVTGKRGMGKTRFVKQMISDLSERNVVWLDNSILDENENIISELLNKLQNLSKYNFYDFVKNNYRLFLDTGKDILHTFLSDKNFFFAHISDLLCNTVSQMVEQHDSSRIIFRLFTSYIDRICENQLMFIVIDNFSRCDKISAHFIMNLMRHYVNAEKIKFCIITTDEDMQLNNDLETEIYMNIPFSAISIQELPSYIFFGEILHKIFDKILFNYDDIKYIYEKCEGSPENLIKIIKKGLKRNAITISNNVITVNKDVLYAILRTEATHFSLNDFKFREQLLLMVMICIGKIIDAEFLKLAVDHMAYKIFMYQQFSSDVFFETLGQLINDKILIYGSNNTLIFEHDSTFLDICDILRDLNLKPQICMYLYELLLETDLMCYGYSLEDYEYYKAFYAAEAKISGWEKINFQYAQSLSHKGAYHDAAKIFDKLSPTYFSDLPSQVFIAACTYYEDGQYQKSVSLLHMMKLDNINNNSFLYQYYFILGKAENILTEKRNAIDHFKMALSFVNNKSPEYVDTLNLLHLTYMETCDGQKKAKQIFEYVKNNFEIIAPLEWAKTMRGAANFYNEDEALLILEKARVISESQNNQVENAYIENSLGFIYLRKGDISEAEKRFGLAYEMLRNIKRHETSYALNNHAICHMLNGNPENALADLLEALLWNSSPYAYYTINCHLCACYLKLGREKEAQKICSVLEHYLFSNEIEDLVVLRKIKINLGIAYCEMNENILGKSFFSGLQLNDIIGTSSEYRYRLYTKQLYNYVNKNMTPYYMDTTFEPWILIYGHD